MDILPYGLIADSPFGDLDSTEILQDGNWIQGNINDATMYRTCVCILFTT